MNYRYLFHVGILFIYFCVNTTSFAQEPFDCIYALEICDSATLIIEYEDPVGSIEEPVVICDLGSSYKSFLDDNTVWLKYHFNSSGDFLFTIASTSSEDNIDIDFVVFKSATNSCDDLKSIRCMFTGMNFMQSTDSLCLGATGLSPQSTDTVEAPGCQPGDDNFLAPVEVNAGDILYLAVMDFTHNSIYSIKHGGSAEISCMPVGTKNLDLQKISIYPNPATNQIKIDIDQGGSKNYNLQIFNAIGERVLDQDIDHHQNVNIDALVNGLYFISIISDNVPIYYSKFIKSV